MWEPLAIQLSKNHKVKVIDTFWYGNFLKKKKFIF